MNLTWERIGSATGIAYFASVTVAILTFDFGAIPDPGSSANEIRTFYSNNLVQWRLANLVLVIGVGFLFWFMGSLRYRVALAEENRGRMAALVYGGGLLTAFLYLLEFSTTNGLDNITKFDDTTVVAYHSVVRALHRPLLGASTVTRAILLSAVALASLRVTAMPKWFGWITLPLAMTSAMGVFAYWAGGAMGWVWLFAYYLFPTWILIASIIMTIHPRPPLQSTSES